MRRDRNKIINRVEGGTREEAGEHLNVDVEVWLPRTLRNVLESHQRNLVDSDMSGAESPLLTMRIYGLILHFLVILQ